ncbi:hypothetical protein OROHE_023627 [Orobanche hederae]
MGSWTATAPSTPSAISPNDAKNIGVDHRHVRPPTAKWV